jgi:hypothetical protein
MIKIHLEDRQLFDESTSRFITVHGGDFTFEHSLKAVAEWESKWKTPFMANTKKSYEQLVDYYTMMAIGERPSSYLFTTEVCNSLATYCMDTHTATVINDNEPNQQQSFVTSEAIYAMMAMAGVPFECENWNLNRLTILLQVIAERSKPQKKMNVRDILAQNVDLNRKRREALNSKG